MIDTHTYDFGYAGNAYFNGRDATITRDDGETVRFNVKDDMLAVEVKDYNWGLRPEAPEDVKRYRFAYLAQAREQLQAALR